MPDAKNIVLVQPYKGFDISVGGSVFKGFRVTSEWNGMMELRDETGQVLVIDVQPNAYGLKGVFGDAVAAVFSDDPKRKATIIKGSPSLLADLMKETPK